MVVGKREHDTCSHCNGLLVGRGMCTCNQWILTGYLSNPQGCGICYTPVLGEWCLQGHGSVRIIAHIQGIGSPSPKAYRECSSHISKMNWSTWINQLYNYFSPGKRTPSNLRWFQTRKATSHIGPSNTSTHYFGASHEQFVAQDFPKSITVQSGGRSWT